MPPSTSHSLASPALGAVQLLCLLKSGEVSAVEVLEAHLARIEEVQPTLNAMVVLTTEAARRAAEAADALRLRGEPLGALHGLPITIKECFQLAGTSATMGLAHLAGKPDSTDGPLVARLKAAGAVILGKTNVPQLMLMHETDGPLFGRTNHPQDPLRGPGGSSGGEAAIIAAGGSALGLASDLGGSIRQPAHATGICGLLPTPGRLTLEGCALNFSRWQPIRLQPGPLARRVEDLSLAMQVLTPGDARHALPDEAPVAWRNPAEVNLAGVRVAMWQDDDLFTPSPAVRRAVRESADHLRAAGMIVEEFTPTGMEQVLELYLGLLSADGLQGLRRLLAGEEIDWRLRRLLFLARLPNWSRPALAWLLKMRGQKRLSSLITSAGARPTAGYWRLVERLEVMTKVVLAELQHNNYSALLFPPHGLPALTHGSSAYLLSAASYCFLANLLGLPAGVVPVTQVRPGEESDRPDSRDISEQTARRVEQGSAGLPIGVQVAALPWREDLVLAMLRHLELARQSG